MLRASSLGCWPAQSQECRAMLIRAMSSRMKSAPSPIRPPPPIDGSAAESSGSARMKTNSEWGASDDCTAQKDHDQSLTPVAKKRPRKDHKGVYPSSFVLPPAGRNFIPPRLSSRDVIRKRHLPWKHALNPIPRVNMQRPAIVLPPSRQKPHLSVSSVNGKAARKDDKKSSHKLHAIPHNRSSGKSNTSETPTPTKLWKSQVARTRQIFAKSRAKAVKNDSSIAKKQEEEKPCAKPVKPNSLPANRKDEEKLRAKPVRPNSSTATKLDEENLCAKPGKPNSSIAKNQEEEKLYITTESPHHVGRTWQPLPIKPIDVPPLSRSFRENKQVWGSWPILYESTSANDAWNAYTILKEHTVHVPPAALHRMVRLFARERPRASKQYTRLLEIIKQLRPAGGNVYLHEWNALIHAAGNGWRRTQVKHYELALSYFRDMTQGRTPGTTFGLDSGHDNVEDEIMVEPVKPDIYTYTTLLGIAARTKDTKCLSHARMLLERSGIPPNRFTHLTLMTYFSATSQSGAVRSTLIMLEREKMELGLDGINALLSAYSQNRRLDVVMMIYRLLKHNLTPDLEEPERLDEYRRQLRTEEFIDVPDYLVPNEVTYTSLIQSMAYHGNLSIALMILADMLNAPNAERGASLIRDPDGVLKPAPYQPTAHVFRALFLGFRRHASGPVPRRRHNPDLPDEWTLKNLQQVLDLFMSMPSNIHVGSSAFYWIIVAFQTASGKDRELVRDVWKRVKGRFRRPLTNRLRILKASLFPEQM